MADLALVYRGVQVRHFKTEGEARLRLSLDLQGAAISALFFALFRRRWTHPSAALLGVILVVALFIEMIVQNQAAS